MISTKLIAVLAVLLTATALPASAQAPKEKPPIVVKMLDDSYEPSTINVRPGDVIHFLQVGARKHNVEFRAKGAPEGFDFGPQRRGPYLSKPGQIYEVRIDERFNAGGEYPFICTPHSFMMKGSIKVAG